MSFFKILFKHLYGTNIFHLSFLLVVTLSLLSFQVSTTSAFLNVSSFWKAYRQKTFIVWRLSFTGFIIYLAITHLLLVHSLKEITSDGFKAWSSSFINFNRLNPFFVWSFGLFHAGEFYFLNTFYDSLDGCECFQLSTRYEGSIERFFGSRSLATSVVSPFS